MSDVAQVVKAAKAGPQPVYLFSGDEFLVRQAVEQLVDALVPPGARDFNLVTLDGTSADAKAIASHLAQVPMLRGVKLVVVRDTSLLTGKSDLTDEVSRARQLLADGKDKDAARRILAVLSKGGWTVSDLTEATKKRWQSDLGVDSDVLDKGDLARLREIAESEGLKVPESETDTLERLLSGGAPDGNVLVLTAEKPDRRLSLTKRIEKLGEHVVCKAEQTGRTIETLDVSAVRDAVLSRHGKRLKRDAEDLLKRMIGGEMRLLSGELEKLCLYVGERGEITVEDVRAIGVTRVREEAFWELGSAVVGRDLPSALWYLHDAFDHGRHPIPVLAGISSALRRAAQVRSVAERHRVRRGTRNLPGEVVDEIAALRPGRRPHPFALLKEWERSLAWPGVEALMGGLSACRDADLALKTSQGDPRLVVERLVLRLCRA